MKRNKNEYGLGKRNPWEGQCITDWKFLKEHLPQQWEKLKAEMAASQKIKIARSCFTCIHRAGGKGRDNFVRCSLRDCQTWVKARCPQWELTLTPSRLSEYERHVDTKYLLQNPAILQLYYGKRTENHTDTTLMLGRACFTCRFRGNLKGNKTHCNKRDRMVWTQACCRHWKVEDDWKKRLPKYKGLMKRAGADVDGIPNWIEYRVDNTKISSEIEAQIDEWIDEWKAGRDADPEDEQKIERKVTPLKEMSKEDQEYMKNYARNCGWIPKEESYESFMERYNAYLNTLITENGKVNLPSPDEFDDSDDPWGDNVYQRSWGLDSFDSGGSINYYNDDE